MFGPTDMQKANKISKRKHLSRYIIKRKGSGPGLGFVAYPEALAHLPGQNIWTILFFIMLLSLALDSRFGSFECIVIAAIDIWPSLMRKRTVVIIVLCGFFALSGIIFCFQTIFISGMVSYKAPTHGDYQYPNVAIAFGFILSLIPLIPIPVFAIRSIKKAPGHTFKEKFIFSLRPNSSWKPAETSLQELYTNKEYHEGTIMERMKLNIFGD
ncbi:Hypothetical predicted protein [Mytilus galloprovincialis]|uniref:Uncharacterized protein n=1 Tax=Mytilus galloprovincialis TaxID=29158 RepID=A0A8B6FKD7_MYTGA|nr:Hypothetical predicted protein [Mytilus galloprovincialis]